MLAELILLGVIPFSSNLTYRDVQPIFKVSCAQCHNANWPDKNWLEYKNAYRDRVKIRFRVWDARTMPPGMQMSDTDRKKIKDWVDQGAKE